MRRVVTIGYGRFAERRLQRVQMRLHLRHSRSYHEWPNATPVVDVVGTVIAAASVVIGSYAALFLALAVQAGDERLALKNALFFVAIALANGLVDVVRHWRRHHG